MKIRNLIVLGNDVTITFEGGKIYSKKDCTKEFIEKLVEDIKNNIDVHDYLFPEINRVENVKKSSILVYDNNSAKIPSISNLTLPQMLVDKIIDAENKNDQNALTAYKNFWTLLSLNPNSNVRKNLFWFIEKWNMQILKSGLFIAYRNVDLMSDGVKYNQKLTKIVSQEYMNCKKTGTNPLKCYIYTNGNEYRSVNEKIDNPQLTFLGSVEELYRNMIATNDNAGTVYTDNRTRTFEIRLGHIVSMPRSEVDENSENQCSRGLHVGAKGWLQNNYCGKIALKVLVNPADCCAAPHADNYGKMRTCAYYPIQVVDFKNNKIDDTNVPDGFEFDFMQKISYDGVVNNIDNDNYMLSTININREQMYKNLKEIASSINRYV